MSQAMQELKFLIGPFFRHFPMWNVFYAVLHNFLGNILPITLAVGYNEYLKSRFAQFSSSEFQIFCKI